MVCPRMTCCAQSRNASVGLLRHSHFATDRDDGYIRASFGAPAFKGERYELVFVAARFATRIGCLSPGGRG
jgi:hypothetical protein